MGEYSWQNQWENIIIKQYTQYMSFVLWKEEVCVQKKKDWEDVYVRQWPTLLSKLEVINICNLFLIF